MTKPKLCELCRLREVTVGVIHVEGFFFPRINQLSYLRKSPKLPLLLCPKCFEIHRRNLRSFKIDYETYDATSEEVKFT